MEFVSLEVKGHVGAVTFCRPPVNAVNTQSYKEFLYPHFRKSTGIMKSVSPYLLQGKGKMFMAGNDLTELQSYTWPRNMV